MSESQPNPFSTPLVQSEKDYRMPEHPKLLEFEGNPDYIIRALKLENIEGRWKGGIGIEKALETGRRLFAEIKEHYGIDAPVRFMRRKDERGIDALYSVTDKIDGKDLERIIENDFDANPDHDAIVGEMKALYASIARYCEESLHSDDYYLWDITRGEQYVYGSSAKNPEKRMYLVDTDIHFAREKGFLMREISFLAQLLMEMEIKTGQRFEKARSELQRIVDSPIPGLIQDPEEKEAFEALQEKLRTALGGLPTEITEQKTD